MELKFSLQDNIKHLYNVKLSVYYNLFNPSRFKKLSSISVAKTSTLHKKSLERPAIIGRRSASGNILSYYKNISSSKFYNKNSIITRCHDSFVSFSKKAYEPPIYMEEELDDD